ncbi:hypothetical protein [Providencia stuartii]|uniref:hypothetical protein n=1 Tax=Providencia stuartii TaxID=588 RepID=UPI00300D3236
MGLNTTPSPWEVRDGFIYGADGDIVAEGYGYVGDDNLIAAAPELLEALIKLTDYVSDDSPLRNTDEFDLAKAAIAKALGQQ